MEKLLSRSANYFGRDVNPVAKAVIAAEWLLLPLTLVPYALQANNVNLSECLKSLSQKIPWLTLQNQRDALLIIGLEQARDYVYFFELSILVTTIVLVARLAVIPWLPKIDWRGVLAIRSMSIAKFAMLWIFMGPGVIVASLDFTGANSTPLLGLLLRHSPLFYLWLTNLVFVFGAISLIEGFLIFVWLVRHPSTLKEPFTDK